MAMMYGMHVFEICEICYRVELWLIVISKYFGTFLVNFTKVSHLYKV
jgi:hypothetical protein